MADNQEGPRVDPWIRDQLRQIVRAIGAAATIAVTKELDREVEALRAIDRKKSKQQHGSGEVRQGGALRCQ